MTRQVRDPDALLASPVEPSNREIVESLSDTWSFTKGWIKDVETSADDADLVLFFDQTDEEVKPASIANILSGRTLTNLKINDTSSDHQYVVTVSELADNRNINLPLLTSDDEFTFNSHAQTLTNKTLLTPTLIGSVYGGVTVPFNWETRPSGTDNLVLIAEGYSGDIVDFEGSTGNVRFNYNLSITGSLSKGSGSFRITHPLKPKTHDLVHSFVESPRAENLYSGMVRLVNGQAKVNIDEHSGMTEGTYAALNHTRSWSSSNETGYAPVKCSMNGNLLSIECLDPTSSDLVYFEVRGERKDKHMLETDWTDKDGRVIVEPEKP